MSTHKPIDLDAEAQSEHHAYSSKPEDGKASKAKVIGSITFMVIVAVILTVMYWPSAAVNLVSPVVQQQADAIAKDVKSQSDAFAASQPPATVQPDPVAPNGQAPTSIRGSNRARPANAPPTAPGTAPANPK